MLAFGGVTTGFVVERVVEAGFIYKALVQGAHQLGVRPGRGVADATSPVPPPVDGLHVWEELARKLSAHLGWQVALSPELIEVSFELSVEPALKSREDAFWAFDAGVEVKPEATRALGVEFQTVVR